VTRLNGFCLKRVHENNGRRMNGDRNGEVLKCSKEIQ